MSHVLLLTGTFLRSIRPSQSTAVPAAGVRRRFQDAAGKDGAQAAELLGADALPLLEAAIVWRADRIQPGVAAFALARFQQERSIAVLLAHAAGIGTARRGSLAAAALRDFGDKGIATAVRPATAPPRKR